MPVFYLTSECIPTLLTFIHTNNNDHTAGKRTVLFPNYELQFWANFWGSHIYTLDQEIGSIFKKQLYIWHEYVFAWYIYIWHEYVFGWFPAKKIFAPQIRTIFSLAKWAWKAAEIGYIQDFWAMKQNYDIMLTS